MILQWFCRFVTLRPPGDRWELAELLDREEKEKIFEEHIESLFKRNKEMFHKLLDETNVSPQIPTGIPLLKILWGFPFSFLSTKAGNGKKHDVPG